MKRLRTILLSCGLIMLLSACDVFSLHPIAEAKDVIFIDDLVGNWYQENNEELLEQAKKHSWQFNNPDSVYNALVEPCRYKFSSVNTGKREYYKLEKSTNDIIDDKLKFSTIEYRVELTDIDGQYWASFKSDEDKAPSRGSHIAMNTFLIKAHGFAKVYIYDDSIKFNFLNYEWFKETLKKNRMKIDHEMVGSSTSPQIVLTANTQQLRNLMAHIEHIDEAFEDEMVVLTRKKSRK